MPEAAMLDDDERFEVALVDIAVSSHDNPRLFNELYGCSLYVSDEVV
jgi:hypothetical protein